jgi:hypothetical protein
MEPFDIFIPVAPKDAVKIPFLLDSIRKYVPGYDRVYLCTARDDVPSDDALGGRPVVRVRQTDVLPMDLRRLRHRPNWIYQMFLKLFQTVTTHDLYLTVDSDVVFNRTMPMFTPEGKRILYLGGEQNHDPYFRFQEMLLDLPRVYAHTFINDMNFMDRRIIREMLDRNGYTVASFLDRSCEVISVDCYPGEPEIWGQYVHKHHAARYEYRQAQTRMMAKGVSRFDEPGWTTGEIEQTIAALEGAELDMLMFHSWFTTNEAQ